MIRQRKIRRKKRQKLQIIWSEFDFRFFPQKKYILGLGPGCEPKPKQFRI